MVETTAKDEIGVLARNFNAMSGGLTKIVRNMNHSDLFPCVLNWYGSVRNMGNYRGVLNLLT